MPLPDMTAVFKIFDSDPAGCRAIVLGTGEPSEQAAKGAARGCMAKLTATVLCLVAGAASRIQN